MGFGIQQTKSQFKIAANNFKNALVAVQSLHGKETIKNSRGAHFSYVHSNFWKQNKFEEIMNAWRWRLLLDSKGNAIDIQFRGENLGDDKQLFDVIAPYVESGSYIEMKGDNDCAWRWIFSEKICKEVVGKPTAFIFDE